MNESRTLRVRFCCKPMSLEHVLHCARSDGWHDEVDALITDVRVMTIEEYDTFAASFFRHHDWLADCGGRNALRQWLAIEVAAPGRNTLYINPEGYSYARYVGVAVEK